MLRQALPLAPLRQAVQLVGMLLLACFLRQRCLLQLRRGQAHLDLALLLPLACGQPWAQRLLQARELRVWGPLLLALSPWPLPRGPLPQRAQGRALRLPRTRGCLPPLAWELASALALVSELVGELPLRRRWPN